MHHCLDGKGEGGFHFFTGPDALHALVFQISYKESRKNRARLV
jgi:hypothetical protein